MEAVEGPAETAAPDSSSPEAGAERMRVATLDAIRRADDTRSQHGKLIDVPDWGVSVRIRGLTRGEVRKITSPDMSAEEADAFAVHRAFVEPKVTVEEAREILDVKGFKATEAILKAILDLSGLGGSFRS